MSLTRDDVEKVARLARLRLTEGELATMTSQLADVLDYFQRLSELDTEDVEPMAHAVELSGVFRADRVRPSLPREVALQNAPKADGECYLVPPVLE